MRLRQLRMTLSAQIERSYTILKGRLCRCRIGVSRQNATSRLTRFVTSLTRKRHFARLATPEGYFRSLLVGQVRVLGVAMLSHGVTVMVSEVHVTQKARLKKLTLFDGGRE